MLKQVQHDGSFALILLKNYAIKKEGGIAPAGLEMVGDRNQALQVVLPLPGAVSSMWSVFPLTE